MKLHHSGFKTFLENPEVYRWQYGLNLVPKGEQYALDRGIAMHAFIEGKTALELPPDISTATAKAGWDMAQAYLKAKKESGYEIIARELEYCYPIPHGKHEIVGRLDAIARYTNGRLVVLEYKGAGNNKRLELQRAYWQDEKEEQAATVIMGARSLGYDVETCEVIYILEGSPRGDATCGNPPKVWPVIDAWRSDFELASTMLAFHQVADMIEMCMELYGPEQPWLHTHHFNFGCKVANVQDSHKWAQYRCPYRFVCGQALKDVDPYELEKFEKRREHLSIMSAMEGV